METIKRSRRRLAISLLTIIAMVFTLIPCMGGSIADAATGDRTEVSNYATDQNPIDKVIFEERSDGRFDVYVHFDSSVYNKSHYKEIKGWVVLDGKQKAIMTGWDNDTVKANNYTMKLSYYKWSDSSVAAGEKMSLAAGAYNDSYYENSSLNYKWVNLQNGNDYAYAGAREFTAPVDPIAESKAFTGFKAEIIYSTNNNFMGVDVGFDSYEGTDIYGNNVFYREDVKRETITCVQNGSYHSEGIIGYDAPPYLDTTYTYYVAKESSLEGTLPDLTRTEGSKVTLSASTKTKLQSISAYATVTTPEPEIPKISGLSISAGLKKANLSWRILYNTYSPNVTEYQVYRYHGDTYKQQYTIKPGYSNATGTTITIPYAGTSKFKVRIYYKDSNGKSYYSDWSNVVACNSKSISAASGSVTKISSKKARITINKSEGSTGTMVYQYVSGMWKYIGKTTGSSYTVTKNTAGKKKYRLRSYIVDNGKTYYSGSYSGTYSPKSNTAAFKYSSRPAAYPMYSHYWRPDKIYYSGNKVVVKGKFINTHIYNLDYFKIKLTVKCQGKVIGTKTINSGKMKSNKVKKVTVKLDKSKAGYDLRAGNLTWSYKIIKWR